MSSEKTSSVEGTDIAIIGLAGRFPKAKNVEEFWKNLSSGLDSITFFSDEELKNSGISETLINNPNYVKAGMLLENMDMFDASFFGFSPREAQLMDPQHRLLLEVCWEALENAGYDSEKTSLRIGVFTGTDLSRYLINNICPRRDFIDSLHLTDTVSLSNSGDFLPTQISYKLNLKGPSINVQTACSTSLVTVHLACQSLLNYESDVALAGGSAITLLEKEGYLYQDAGIFSSDGHCRAFDAKAQGTLAGSGAAIVVLKRLADAIDDNDTIYGIIKGSAINNDGAAKAGFTAPSVEGQSKVIIEALTLSDTPAESISYIETHGTATALGDLVEIAALTKAFQTSTDKKQFCAIGSVKPNIGHLNSAAGIAGLVKTLLALRHKQIPPSLYFETPNPKIDFASSPFFVNNKLREWNSLGARRAGVSSFGFGGTNAHIVLEEANFASKETPKQKSQIIVLSAKTLTALDTMTSNLVSFLKENPDVNISDLAYTNQIGRKEFANRRFLVCQNINEAIEDFTTLDPKKVLSKTAENYSKSVAFMFPGQGNQYVNMGQDLYSNQPLFCKYLDECLDLLKPLVQLDLRNLLYPAQENIELASQEINQTEITQPLLFAIEYALAKLWISWGFEPKAMIGHSIGEYVAAHLAGVFSLADAVKLVANRGKLMQTLPLGKMVSVKLPENEIIDFLDDELSLAVLNSPADSVVSGSQSAIEKLIGKLEERKITYNLLHTSHAFHSKMMDPILSEFREVVESVSLNSPQIPFLSNLTGSWISDEEAKDPNYWVKHLRNTVRFSDGLEKLLSVENSVLIEVGPSLSLSSLAKNQNPESHIIVASLPHPKEKISDLAFILNSLGKLWLSGAKIEWQTLYPQTPKRIALPSYPFERQRHWFEPQEQNSKLETKLESPSFLGKQVDINKWFYVPSWKRTNKLQFSRPNLLEEKNWLIFLDDLGLGKELAKELEHSNQKVSQVVLGQQFEKLSENSYLINPERLSDYNSLMQDLKSSNALPNKIIYLWGVKANSRTQEDLSNKFHNVIFCGLFFLAQAINKENISQKIEIFALSNNLQEVIGEEIIQPEKATLIGATTVIPQEIPNIDCCSIDLVFNSNFVNTQTINNLINEFVNFPKEKVIAYRQSYRWVRTFEPISLETNTRNSLLKPRGVYLITGGLGGIALQLAEYLSDKYKAKLVLLGRSPFPPRTEWKTWLSKYGQEDETSKKILKLQKIEELGGEVLVINSNLTDKTEAQMAFTQALERFDKINGIFHTAGVAGSGLIALKTYRVVEEVFQPKIQVIKVINSLIKKLNLNLDFLVLFSSNTALTGGLGQIDYCAANAFLDAFSYYSNQEGILTISINWDAWKDVGMAVKTPLPDYLAPLREEYLKNAISNSEGIESLSRILSSPMPQVIVSTRAFQASLEEVKRNAVELLNNLQNQESQNRPNLSSSYVAPSNAIEEKLVEIWQDLLGVEQIGIHDNFLELGGNSLLGVQVIGQISEHFQVEIPMFELFESLTISELAQTILIKIAEETDEEALEDIFSEE